MFRFSVFLGEVKGETSRNAFSQFKERKPNLVLKSFLFIFDFSKEKIKRKYSISMLNNTLFLADAFTL